MRWGFVAVALSACIVVAAPPAAPPPPPPRAPLASTPIASAPPPAPAPPRTASAEPPPAALPTGAVYVHATALELRLEPRDDATLATHRMPLNLAVTAGPVQGDWVMLESGLNRGWAKRPDLGSHPLTADDVARELARAADPAARMHWLELAAALDPYRAEAWTALRDAYIGRGDRERAARIESVLTATEPVIVGICGNVGTGSKNAGVFLAELTPGRQLQPLIGELPLAAARARDEQVLAWVERLSATSVHVVGSAGSSAAVAPKLAADPEKLEHQLVTGSTVRNLPRLTVEGCRDATDEVASSPVVASAGWIEPLVHRGSRAPWRIKIEPVRGLASCFEVTADDGGTLRRVRVPTEFDACAPTRAVPQLAR